MKRNRTAGKNKLYWNVNFHPRTFQPTYHTHCFRTSWLPLWWWMLILMNSLLLRHPHIHLLPSSRFFYIADDIQMKRDGDDAFQRQARSVLVGPQVKRVNLVVEKHHKAVRVGFHLGGLFRLLGIPMFELVDEGLDASLVWPSEMRQIDEQMVEAADHESVKNIIEGFLIRRLIKLKALQPVDLAIRNLVMHDGLVSIETLARDSCMSLRQFERVCKLRLGLRPKLFSRITRFSKAYRLSEASKEVNWTSIAYECGYFDQMHMIRDFKEFAGVNPGIIESQISSAPLRLQKDLRL